MNKTNYGYCQNYLVGYGTETVGINPKTKDPICRLKPGIEEFLNMDLSTLYSTKYTE